MITALRALTSVRAPPLRYGQRHSFVDKRVKQTATNGHDQQIFVALLSSNKHLELCLNEPPFNENYVVNMFTTTQGPNLAPFDVVLLDAGLPEFTVESYIARVNPPGKSNQSQTSSPRVFPDFRELYDIQNFVRYAEATEASLAPANEQLAKWKQHLLNEAGSSLIRIRDQRSNQLVPKRCVLVPGTAIAEWGLQLNVVMAERVLSSLKQFPDHDLQLYQEDKHKMPSLFYVKRTRMDNGDRHSFAEVPFWKMEIMLKKWRTDQATEEWSRTHKAVWGSL